MPRGSYVHGNRGRPLIGKTIGALLNEISATDGSDEALVVAHQKIRWTYSEPHAAAYNASAAPAALDRVARVLGAPEAADALFDLAAMNGAPTSPRQIGMSESDLDKVADEALQSAYWNPRPICLSRPPAVLSRSASDGHDKQR